MKQTQVHASNQTKVRLDKSRQQIKQLNQELKLARRSLREANSTIEAMKSSKFWKLRNVWFRLVGKTTMEVVPVSSSPLNVTEEKPTPSLHPLKKDVKVSPSLPLKEHDGHVEKIQIGMASAEYQAALKRTPLPGVDYSTDPPPIAVYQMGKVGSTSVLTTLKNLKLANPIYHVHVLSHVGLLRSIQHHRKFKLNLPLQIDHGLAMRLFLDHNIDNVPAQVITGIRDPIAQIVSSFFQRAKNHSPHFIDAEGNWKIDEITQHLLTRLKGYDVNAFNSNCNWFDNEFKLALGVNIYDYEFDKVKGYQELAFPNLNLLILRLESSQQWSEALSQFLKLDEPLEVVSKNKAEQKEYKDAYDQVRSQLKLPPSLLETIYSTRFCRHFYSPEMLDEFIKKWSI